MILRVEMELLYFETFGGYDSIGTLCKLCYSEVATYLKLEIIAFVKLLYNDRKSFFLSFIQILIADFCYTKRLT